MQSSVSPRLVVLCHLARSNAQPRVPPCATSQCNQACRLDWLFCATSPGGVHRGARTVRHGAPRPRAAGVRIIKGSPGGTLRFLGAARPFAPLSRFPKGGSLDRAARKDTPLPAYNRGNNGRIHPLQNPVFSIQATFRKFQNIRKAAFMLTIVSPSPKQCPAYV